MTPQINACCALVAPTFRAGVIADFIDDCWERGGPPTPAEIEPFLRPKVRELVWRVVTAGSLNIDDSWTANVADGWYTITHRNGVVYSLNWRGHEIEQHESLELAQAAAQSHWHERAMAFWREAFTT